MARLPGVDGSKAGPLVRIAYFLTRRKLGRVIAPIKIHAYHPRLLRGLAGMELAQEAARHVDADLKNLASIRAAMQVGCPF